MTIVALAGLATAQAASAADYSARFISQTVPSSVGAGQRIDISITFMNDGQRDWSSASLGSEGPRDNHYWDTNRIKSSAVVRSGQSYTYRARLIAPTAPGTYTFQWRLVQSGVGWFGARSQIAYIRVTGRGAPRAEFVVPGSASQARVRQVVGAEGGHFLALYRVGAQKVVEVDLRGRASATRIRDALRREFSSGSSPAPSKPAPVPNDSCTASPPPRGSAPASSRVESLGNFLDALYETVLKRRADARGRDDWLGVLLSRRRTREQVARAFVESDENLRRIIRSEWMRLLGRNPRGYEVSRAIRDMRRAKDARKFLLVHLASLPEYRRRNGTGKRFVDAAYRHILGRRADPGSAGYVKLAARGRYRQVADSLVDSVEFQYRQVNRIWEEILGLRIDARGRNTLIRALMRGYSLFDIEVGALNDPQFFKRAQR